MALALPPKPGITGATFTSVPDPLTKAWWRRIASTQLSNADVRNAIAGRGISISGLVNQPATISANTSTLLTKGTFTATGTGFSDNPAPSGTGYYKILDTLIWVFLPLISGTSSANTFTITGLPAVCIPATFPFQEDNIGAFDAGTEINGLATISAGSSIITIANNGAVAGWTPTGNKGAGLRVLTYFLD